MLKVDKQNKKIKKLQSQGWSLLEIAFMIESLDDLVIKERKNINDKN